MKLRTALLLIAVVYISAFFLHASHLQKTVYGDGVFYYAWVRSVVVDRDIDFSNDYTTAEVNQPLTRFGTPGNKYSVGPALLWAPAFVLTHIVIRGSGWELPYQIAVGVTSVLFALFGFVLLARVLHATSFITGAILLLIAGATNLFFYGAIDPVNSHALSFFAASFFLALCANVKKHSFWIGITLALIAMIRLQDIVYAIVLIPFLPRLNWRATAIGFLVGFLPQLVAWFALYGTLSNPYLAGGETFDVLHPHILGVLFGAQSGLFLWTPIVAIGLLGLILDPKGQRPSTLGVDRHIFASIFLIQLLIVSSWSSWSQGASYSGRMFVSILPIAAIGLIPLIKSLSRRLLLRKILPLLITALCVVNAMGIFYFLFTT